MNDSVLNFALDLLTSNNINTHILSDGKIPNTLSFDLGLRKGILDIHLENDEILTGLDELEKNTIYHITDAFGCLYTLMQLPTPSNDILFLGPTMENENWETLCQEISIEKELTSVLQKQLHDYYIRLPKLSQIRCYHSIIFELGKYLFGETLHIRYLKSEYTKPYDSGSTAAPLTFMEYPILSMQMMEERFELENRLLDAIRHGNETLALQALQNFRGITVPLLDSQNIPLSVQYQLVGLNSLFRKEAEQMDVHPLYINRLSNQILFQIQKLQSERDSQKLVMEMIKQYCSLIKNYSLAGYSPIIRNIIRNIIRYARIHLNEDLSLRELAKRFHINRTYLSTLFHQETGTTLTDYINHLRIEYAIRLLQDTDLSIASISIELGFSDISYFTRVFKKVTRQTPAQYMRNCKDRT